MTDLTDLIARLRINYAHDGPQFTKDLFELAADALEQMRAELAEATARERIEFDTAMWREKVRKQAETERDALRAELAVSKADAERYRWLQTRDHSLEAQHGAGLSCYHIVDSVRELKYGIELDAAIDAARAQGEKPDGAATSEVKAFCEQLEGKP
jgi:hypothetical protein